MENIQKLESTARAGDGTARAGETRQPENDGGIGNILAIGLSVLALIVSGYLFYKTQHTANANVAVVNSDLVIQAFLKKNINKDQAALLKDFQKINAWIAEQSQNGILIINTSAAAGIPESMDLTPVLATQMGLTADEIKAAEEDFNLRQDQKTTGNGFEQPNPVNNTETHSGSLNDEQMPVDLGSDLD